MDEESSAHTHPVLRCPTCFLALERADSVYHCANTHSFDVARSGYVNLLLSHQKNSKDPGDNKAMVQRRTRFLDQGFYAPVAEAISASGLAHGLRQDAAAIADMGCGEGYYLSQLRQQLAEHGAPAPALFGLDISKHAIQSAARRDSESVFVVGSITALPFLDRAVDLLLNIFSPAHVAEFNRVVKPSGAVLVAGPGPKHLYALKHHLYADARYHAEGKWADAFRQGFALIAAERVEYTLPGLNQQNIDDLLTMTPYGWNASQATRQKIASLATLDVEVDVIINVFRPQP